MKNVKNFNSNNGSKFPSPKSENGKVILGVLGIVAYTGIKLVEIFMNKK